MTTGTTTPAPVAPADEVSDYDAMSAAFDELMAPTSSGESDPSLDDPAPAEADAGASAEPATTPVKEDAAAAAPAEGEAAAAEPAKEPAAPAEDWEARFKELEARVNQQPQPAAEKPPVETPPPDIYAPEEKEFLAEYDKSWPDVAKGEALKRRAEYGELVKHIFTEIARVYDPLIARGAQAADSVAENAALAAISAAHPDYDAAMYDAVVDWANGLTGVRKRVAQEVISDGDPQDVVDLISEFKSATGRSKPRVVAGTAPAAPAASVTELPAKAKQAAKALGVVDSKRTSPLTGQADPDDFDSAWAEAAGSK